jgi:hypothetical protein
LVEGDTERDHYSLIDDEHKPKDVPNRLIGGVWGPEFPKMPSYLLTSLYLFIREVF